VDINGGKQVAHYLYGYRIFDGMVFPAKRHVYRRGEDGTPQKKHRRYLGGAGSLPTRTRCPLIRAIRS
jgi:hypothetical protein